MLSQIIQFLIVILVIHYRLIRRTTSILYRTLSKTIQILFLHEIEDKNNSTDNKNNNALLTDDNASNKNSKGKKENPELT